MMEKIVTFKFFVIFGSSVAVALYLYPKYIATVAWCMPSSWLTPLPPPIYSVTFLIWWSVRSLIWTSQFFLKLSLDVAILLLYWYVNRNEKWRNYEINRDEEECFGITVEGEKNWYKSITVFSILYVYISVDRNRRYILKVKIQRWKIFVVLYITHNGKKDRPVVRRTESCGTYCYTLNGKKKNRPVVRRTETCGT